MHKLMKVGITVFAIFILFGCSTTGKQSQSAYISKLNDKIIREHIQEFSDSMESKDIRLFASYHSSDFLYEDDISAPQKISWDLKTYLMHTVKLFNRVQSVESETEIQNLRLNKQSDAAEVVVRQTTTLLAKGKKHRSKSIQKVLLTLDNGKLKVHKQILLQDLGHGEI